MHGRFKKLTHKAKEVDQLLVSREQRAATKKKKARLMSTMSNVSQGGGRSGESAPPQATEDDIALSQLYSTRAFADFLKQRPNYNPPSFLAAILHDAK